MTNEKTLPPLPASDEKSVSANQYNSFYRVRTREFWGDNEIISEKPEEFKKCKHYFILKPGAAACRKCHFELVGFFEVQKGKLFFKGKKIGL